MASKKSKVLAIAFCAAVMSGIYANPALAYDVWNNDTLGYQKGTTTTTTGTTLKNPEIHHQEEGFEIPGGSFDRPVHENGDEACEESADRITIGDINKVKNDLVDNDKQNAEAIDNLETKVDGINEAIESGALKGEKGEDGKDGQDGKDGVDGKDGASIASGEYNVQDGTGIVQMPIEDEDGNKVGDVQINNIASQNDLKDETVARENADKELADKIGQEEMNRVNEDAAIRGEIGTEHAERVEADQELADKIGQEEMNRVNEDAAIRGEIGTEHAERVEADQELADKIGQEEMNRVNEDAAIRGEISTEHAGRVEADQELADKIGQEEMNRVNEDAAIRGEISTEHAGRVEADEQLQANIDAEESAREEADTALGNRIDEEIQNRTEADTKLQENINAETAAREEADAQLASDIKNEALDREQADTALGNRIDEEIQNRTEADTKLQGQINDVNTVTGAANKGELDAAYSGTNYIEGSASMVEADQRLDAAISDVSTRVDGIENRVDGLEDRIDKVGAMSAAIANLRTMGYDPAAPTEVAVGVGQYRDETGMALGLFHYPNRDFMLSLSVSTSGDEYMGGIGATWKFGRKSPEKVAEIKKAQAEADARRAEEQKLAKAEEMKKAAKEAKVQAQMERHAKMLAEQEAQA